MRHSRSFVISLLIHAGLLASLFLAYKELKPALSESKEQRVAVPLCCLTKEQRAVPHVHDTPLDSPKPKKETPKELPKKVLKQEARPKKITPKELKKVPVKEVEPIPKVKEVLPVAKEEPKEKETPVTEKPVVVEVEQETQPTQSVNDVAQVQEESTQPAMSPQEQYMDEHLAKIVALLQENLYYPRSARRRGVEGEVLVSFVLRKDASVSNITIVSSEHSLLSKGAIETIESLAGKFPHPQEDLELTIPINYTLRK